MTEIYKPLLGVSVNIETQIRLGIQGSPGTGKTTSAMTFPNPVVINWDRGLRAFQGNKDLIQFPMYDLEFVEGKLDTKPSGHHKLYPNYHAAVIKLLKSDNCQKLTQQQTLIFDSWTSYCDADDLWNWEIPYYTNNGKVDDFEAWDVKQDHSKEIFKILADLKCNVIVIFHTSQQRDKETGKILDKIQPLMSGGYMPKLKKHFPFFFNQVVKDGQYLWQTKSDNTFDAKCCCPQDSKIPAFIPANYNELIKYLSN